MPVIDERSAVDSVIRWLRIRERSGHPAPTTYTELVDVIAHSALLRRLLAGDAPLRVPPPRSFGQPWYSLIETGTADDCELRTLKDRPGATPRVTVNEWAWELLDQPEDGLLLIRHHRQATPYVAQRIARDPERWRLVRRDLWPAAS